MANVVLISREVCKGCGLCVATCPKNVLGIEKNLFNTKGYHPATVERMGDCIACAMCAIICPDSAIQVEKEDRT